MQQSVNEQIINLSNCKNCGSARDIYRTSCEYCDTYYDCNNKNEKLDSNNKQYELFKQSNNFSPSGVFF